MSALPDPPPLNPPCHPTPASPHTSCSATTVASHLYLHQTGTLSTCHTRTAPLPSFSFPHFQFFFPPASSTLPPFGRILILHSVRAAKSILRLPHFPLFLLCCLIRLPPTLRFSFASLVVWCCLPPIGGPFYFLGHFLCWTLTWNVEAAPSVSVDTLV